MIRNIVLDFGGVLVAYDFKAYFSKILNSEEKGEWFMEHILTPDNNNLLDKGDRPFKDYISEWKQRWPDYALALDSFDKCYTDIFTAEIPVSTIGWWRSKPRAIACSVCPTGLQKSLMS